MVLSMDRWKGRVAIVTGASAGIGACIAEKLVENGLKVVGLARRKEKLEQLANALKSKPGKLYAFQADITKESDIIAAFEWIKENVGPISILINNAGIARDTNLISGNTEMWKETLDTNILGLCIATREAVRNMRQNDVAGHIVHLNSVLGHGVAYFPTLNVYSASKFAVTALAETLRQELNGIGSKIKITSISPGIVESEFREASGRGKVTDVVGLAHLKAEDVADAVIYTLSTPPLVQVHELTIKPIGEKF